jgi:preprotein translocase subunit SecE
VPDTIITHGEAVAMGIVLAATLSDRLKKSDGRFLGILKGSLDAGADCLSSKIASDFKKCGLPVECPYSLKDMAEVMKSDKKAEAKKAETKKPKKERFKFLKDVSAEMKRVTWPSRPEVIRWSGVVVGALLFFGVFVAVLDNLIVTPLIVALSNLGA